MASNLNQQNQNILNNQNTQPDININDDFNDDDNPYDNLCFNSKLILGMNKYKLPNKESIDSNPIKFSIDMTTAPKKRLQQYLNTDLLDELENESSTLEEDKGDKRQNQQFPMQQPVQQMNPQMQMINQQQITYQNELAQGLLTNMGRNKFDFSQRNKNNSPSKKKKPFEIREGDWTCFDCHNLNFAFRTKCNRCGLFREISNKKCEDFRNSVMSNMNNENY